MSVETQSFTKSQEATNRGPGRIKLRPTGSSPCSAEQYQIEEQRPVKVQVPFDSSLGIAAHFATWICYSAYLVLRFMSIKESPSLWSSLIYLCEVSFMLQELQTAVELSFSLLGPRDAFEYAQYVLRGGTAPKVAVFVTVCGEDLSTIMDTVAAAVFQEYPAEAFKVFVLDDAADQDLQEAVKTFNASSCMRESGYQEVVYSAREKVSGLRHFYKSGNLRAGLDFAARDYVAWEYFASLDADMISESDWLSRTVPHLIKNTDVALVSPPQISYNILEEDLLCQDANNYSQILEPTRGFIGCSQCSGSGYVMRRSAVESIGGWPLRAIGEDIICSNMLLAKGWKTMYIPDQLQFGQSPDSLHAAISQRIRWTYGSLLLGQQFGLSFLTSEQGKKMTGPQRTLSMMGALKAYASIFAFVATVCLPLCFWAFQTGRLEARTGRQSFRLALLSHFVASSLSRKLVYGRLGGANATNIATNRIWGSPFNAFCAIKSLVCDISNTAFKVSGTFISPAEERYAARRKPLMTRMSSPVIIGYTCYFSVAAVALAVSIAFVAHRHFLVQAERFHMHTGAALKLIDLVLAAAVPIRYMAFPPSIPERRGLLVKDAKGIYRSGKKEWRKRDAKAGFKLKLLLQVVVILLFDWL